MKKTLAQFKRDIVPGMVVLCNSIEEARILDTWEGGDTSTAPYGPLQVVPMSEKMQGPRIVTYKDTTGFYLNADPSDGRRGSFCGWPKVQDLEADERTFRITERTQTGQVWQKRHYTLFTNN